jgi:hypothetical protein
MTAIANDYDSLVRSTLTVVYRTRATGVLLQNQIDGLVATLKRLDHPSEDAKTALQELDGIGKTLKDYQFHAADLTDGYALHESWRGRDLGPAPDFVVWYGSNLNQEWADVLKAAQDVMDESAEEFYQGKSVETGKMQTFRQKAMTFQRLLYQRIKDASLDAAAPAVLSAPSNAAPRS